MTNRYDFVLIFDVRDGNPNGDPDADNLPRIDPETCQGLVTDVCLKRKVRNYVQHYVKLTSPKNASSLQIFVKEQAVLNDTINQAVKDAKDAKKTAAEILCSIYYDVRAFGAVISTGDNSGKSDGQLRGPVQMTFARSVDSIVSSNHTITRCAVTNAKDKDKERTMGRKTTVPYGLYVGYGFVSPAFANQTGFSESDLELFWEALQNMFEHDRSAARGLMGTCKLVVLKHDSALGNA
ncbi:MAG: type I-C CRISPR-associated protein Cas7/Csd2, partial [Thermoguttaceae bacterium]|nr:type I-C CRISPR-associated protein Cas7/Csd2 [Thermoguttaceae bacterium]